MTTIYRFLFSFVFVLMLFSCSKDDDSEKAKTTNSPAVEVCIVFAPGELGDQGYADRVLTGMHQFDMQLSEGDYDRVQLRYMVADSTKALALQLSEWDKQGVSPYTDIAYERRLLVLTDASLLPMLADTPLGATDEVLVMNTTDSVFAHTPKADWMGPRLHLLSISAADAARKFCRYIESRNTQSAQPSIGQFLISDNPGMMADSTYAVLADFFKNKFTVGTHVRKPSNTLSDSYISVGGFLSAIHLFAEEIYMVCSWGAHNAAIYAYAYTQDIGNTKLLFLDTEFVGLKDFAPCIVRDYDRALCQWLQRWLAAPAATMPQKEWHGAWDGYVSDNILDIYK